ncbi:MAG TPA: hypothetical protein VLE48_12610 [Terriglobales bacterium]|nr:hypothetical protein [Terriglobales bacterium]
MSRAKWYVAAAALMVMALAVAGCQKEQTATEEAQMAQPAPAKATPIDPATVGSVSGTVKFEGTPPKAVRIDMSQDPACKATSTSPAMSEMVVVDKGNLANVFVYVKDGLGDRTFDVPTEKVTIDQHGCRYHPHVEGVMAGQTVEILNSDDTTHNIHPTPAPASGNREWNESQAPKATPLEKTFAREELMLPVKCNQHPWMKMYINVVKNPFFAVSGADGTFEIKGLPPGEYTIAAVHEKLGEQTMKVTIAAKEAKTAEFSFKGQ